MTAQRKAKGDQSLYPCGGTPSPTAQALKYHQSQTTATAPEAAVELLVVDAPQHVQRLREHLARHGAARHGMVFGKKARWQVAWHGRV